MIPTFSGSGKKARNVNLSGRINSNPFASAGGGAARSGFGAPATQSTVAAAQQDRQARQRERERIQAASRIQRTWRRYARESERKRELRRRWDGIEAQRKGGDLAMTDSDEGRTPQPPYESDEMAWEQLELLLRFVDFTRHDDLERVLLWWERGGAVVVRNDPESATMIALARECLSALVLKSILQDRKAQILEVVLEIIGKIPMAMSHLYPRYYRTLASLAPNADLLTDRATATNNIMREHVGLQFFVQAHPHHLRPPTDTRRSFRSCHIKPKRTCVERSVISVVTKRLICPRPYHKNLRSRHKKSFSPPDPSNLLLSQQ